MTHAKTSCQRQRQQRPTTMTRGCAERFSMAAERASEQRLFGTTSICSLQPHNNHKLEHTLSSLLFFASTTHSVRPRQTVRPPTTNHHFGASATLVSQQQVSSPVLVDDDSFQWRFCICVFPTATTTRRRLHSITQRHRHGRSSRRRDACAQVCPQR